MVNQCIPRSKYTFTIEDSYSDGICCAYGSGSYSVSYAGKPVISGGEFQYNEIVDFGEEECPKLLLALDRPSPSPTAFCQDSVDNFNLEGVSRNCFWNGENGSSRCSYQSVSSLCPVTCGKPCKCFDKRGKFRVKGTPKKRKCESKKKMCSDNAMRSNCPVACGVC